MSCTFSIVTRTALRLLFLARVRDGLVAAAPPASEWIVCDDAPSGTPGIHAFVDQARHRLPFPIQLIESRSGSRPKAANCGLNAARGRFVHLHDDDDSVSPDFYGRTADFLDHHPAYGGVAVLCERVDERVDGDVIVPLRRRPHYHEVRAITLTSMATTQTIAPIAFVARRDVLQAVGPFNEELSVCEDHEYFLRFLLEADIGLIRETLAAFHQRLANGSDGFGNSAASTDHEVQDAQFRNAMLRRDLREGRVGLGWLLANGEANRLNWRASTFVRRLAGKLTRRP